MPSTHFSLHFHFVFSTKNRQPTISEAWQAELHTYLGGLIRNLQAFPEAIGGTSDHVHLLIGFRTTHYLPNVIRDVKSLSSQWVHQEIGERDFAWQSGYGVFSVSSSQLERVKNYILQQPTHHQKLTYQQEYLDILIKTGAQYDERYLW